MYKFERSDDLDAAQAPDLRRHGSVPNNLVFNPCPQTDAERASSRARQNLTFTLSGLLGDRRLLLLSATCNNAAMTMP
jgi:hypothetical protein